MSVKLDKDLLSICPISPSKTLSLLNITLEGIKQNESHTPMSSLHPQPISFIGPYWTGNWTLGAIIPTSPIHLLNSKSNEIKSTHSHISLGSQGDQC